MSNPNLKFARTHEWVLSEGETAKVGISDFAVKELTDLVFMQLPGVGSEMKVGEVFGEVESVKAVSDLYGPVSGTVAAVNSELPGNLQWLSDDPFGKGWIAEIKLADRKELEALMSQDEYVKFCESQAH
ncbi:Glycine cleavage system H protein [Caulifigura coniformis]|uniref:Glycine cleavage system H protein n=1 Tax=Caulifigura coniformis TaxID=2527983 RepID=A0A517SCJ5_9PLAN|nr:glycine cleavage system protein GcvH [Caulifigura coniformis]QDT53847.1 Glycine cleavage system H protein [Caulifigura coniformis]